MNINVKYLLKFLISSRLVSFCASQMTTITETVTIPGVTVTVTDIAYDTSTTQVVINSTNYQTQSLLSTIFSTSTITSTEFATPTITSYFPLSSTQTSQTTDYISTANTTIFLPTSLNTDASLSDTTTIKTSLAVLTPVTSQLNSSQNFNATSLTTSFILPTMKFSNDVMFNSSIINSNATRRVLTSAVIENYANFNADSRFKLIVAALPALFLL
ncbi:hypothetical protein QEN19_000180 [Hanseniaspora menglaensis]